MFKILLTGSNGFVGQHVAFIASQMNDVHVTGWSSRPAIHDFCDDFVQINLASTFISHQMICEFDAVIHTAALSHVDYCEANRSEAFLVNVEATRQLAVACSEAGTHLVHVSSDFVMEGLGKFVEENEPTNPVNYYGRTKEMAEIFVQNILPEATIVRPVLIFGNVMAGTRSNLVLWVKSSLEQAKAITVTEDHYRTATYVVDLAELLIKCALQPTAGVFHACGNSYLSVFKMAQFVAQRFGLKEELISPIHSSKLDAAPRPPCTYFNAQKAVDHFGFVSRDFEEALNLM